MLFIVKCQTSKRREHVLYMPTKKETIESLFCCMMLTPLKILLSHVGRRNDLTPMS